MMDSFHLGCQTSFQIAGVLLHILKLNAASCDVFCVKETATKLAKPEMPFRTCLPMAYKNIFQVNSGVIIVKGIL